MAIDDQKAFSTKQISSDAAQAIDNPTLLRPGTLLDGRYLIEKEIGRGGVGVVYLARDRKLYDTPVVVKLLLEKLGDSERRVWLEKKFKDEVRALAQIDHPGVIRGLDIGQLPDGRSYIVMQNASGVSLRSVMREEGMKFARVASLIRQIGRALSAAHQQGVLHRDLKPENIMLQTISGEEYVKLIDFGIATVLDSPATNNIKTTMVAGTVHYMAPEQLLGRPMIASDIYALGIIVYEMVTGRKPFDPETMFEMLDLQRAGVKLEPCNLRPDLPVAAQAVILKALEFPPQERFTSAKEFGDALADALLTGKMRAGSQETLQIAHILYIQIADYSDLPVERRAHRLEELNHVIGEAKEFRQARLRNHIAFISTGDGKALVFCNGGDAVAAVRCAVEIAASLWRTPDLKLRMGLHTGPVEINSSDYENHRVTGDGLNAAQRVMRCGAAGHILMSESVADVLRQLGEWSRHLQDWGLQKSKDGQPLHIFNLFTNDAGNADQPQKRRIALPISRRAVMMALSMIVAAVALVVLLAVTRPGEPPAIDAKHELRLSYSLTMQKDPKRFPASKPASVFDETIFEAGDQVRLNVTSPQDGYLYIINERPVQINGLPQFNVMFPSATSNFSAAVKANEVIQIPARSENPERDWFIFDDEEGVEKVWLVWSARVVAELEAVKDKANPTDRGVISETNQLRAIARLLAPYSERKIEVEKDEATGQSHIKSKSDFVGGLIELVHRRRNRTPRG